MTNKPENNFDEAVAALRREQLDTETLNASGARVWNRMYGQLAETATAVEKIRGCEDVQALLPAYSAGVLPQARAMIVRDHLTECVECRRHSRHEAGKGAAWQQAAPVASWGLRPLAMAAMLLFAIGITSWFGYQTYFAPVPGSRATVQSVEGALYAMNTEGERLLKVGEEVGEGETMRTPAGGHAFLRLRDGSVVEVDERAEFSVSARRNNTTLHLTRGHVIVQAAKRKSGNLFVDAPDAQVAVTGTVFAVNSGMKGSRVSVVEGEVRVDYADQEAVLHAGDQVSTTAAVGTVPVAQEIAWSRNLKQHLALMAEFANLQKKLETVQMPRLRYDSRIFHLVPATSTFYVSIPNYGEALAEANDIFQQQLQQSPVLQQWWQQQHPKGDAEFQKMIDRLKTISEYIGEEIVVSMTPAAGKRDTLPLVVAEVRRSGLKEFLQAELQKETQGKSGIQILDPSTLATARAGKDASYILIGPEYLILTPDLQMLHYANGLVQAGGNGFDGTEFGQRIGNVYGRGAGIFLALDLAQVVAFDSNKKGRSVRNKLAADATGFTDAKFLLAERRDVNGQAETRAILEFKGERRGMASWLAAPAPMGSLEYVSRNAAAAFAVVSKSPALMLEDMFRVAGGDNPKFHEALARTESKLGFSLRDDLAATLGGDVTLALDGPVLPTPSWKLVAEVYDPVRLQQSLDRLVQTMNQEIAAKGEQKQLTLTSEQVSGRTFYALQVPGSPVSVHYTYADGYMVAGASRALVQAALRTRATGNSLAHAQSFKALLPNDANTNCSGLAYQNLGPVLQPMIDYAGAENADKLRMLAAESKPTVLCAYGETDRIQLATNSRFFGLDLNTITLTTLLEGAKTGTRN